MSNDTKIVEMFRTSLLVAQTGDLDDHDSAYIQGRLNALRDVAKLLKIDLPEPEDQDPTSQNPRFHRTEQP